VAQQKNVSRRGFVKAAAAAAGAAALPGYASAQAASPQAVAPAAPLSLRNVSQFPGLSPRGAGWLRFLWEKATTRDDWSSAGIPHPWWDKYTSPVVLSYGRFDLSYSAYGLLLMADQTPAWREVYTRIADELATRYPTHWGAIDWFTQIGDDPKRANYPPQIMAQIPQAPASTTALAGPRMGFSPGACSPIRSRRTDTCSFVRGSSSCWPRISTSRATTSGPGPSK